MSAQVFRTLDEAQGQFGPAALAIGNFDGVHIGHRALLAAAAQCAKGAQMKTGVLTFHPHPTVFVAPTRVPAMLCTLEERIRLLSNAGVERILVLPFNQDLARFSPEAFVSRILVNGLHAKAVIVGDNFRFGHQQAGTPGVLQELSKQFDFTTKFLKPVKFRRITVSSSAVRQAVSEGKMLLACRLLGRCYSIEGAVVQGHGIGGKQTVPTLNLRPPGGQLLPRGVYVTETFDQANKRRWPSITNVGVRPTFGGDELSIETYLLAPLTGDTPANICIEFRRFVRTERQFNSAEELKGQIMKDVARARTYWRRVAKLASMAAPLY